MASKIRSEYLPGSATTPRAQFSQQNANTLAESKLDCDILSESLLLQITVYIAGLNSSLTILFAMHARMRRPNNNQAPSSYYASIHC